MCIAFFIVLLFVFPLAADNSRIQATKVIVLDPGHGGNDLGSKGPQGTYEKDVVLKLSRMIEAESDPALRIFFTRSDDY
jgi:N-acetylmuramoyl-L-alanine amidase